MAAWKLLTAIAVSMLGIAEARIFEVHNRMGETIWVGIQGNTGFPAPMGGGFELALGRKVDVHTDDNWRGRFWARTGCRFDDSGQGQCETGDCGRKLQCNGDGGAPPATLAEFTLAGHEGNDYYDISILEGFNVPTAIETVYRQGSGNSCTTASCTSDVNGQCPTELRQVVNGSVVGCKSACAHYNTDAYCCRGQHGQPNTCHAGVWPRDYPGFFKHLCPNAYSYAYDDTGIVFKCSDTDYRIVFG